MSPRSLHFLWTALALAAVYATSATQVSAENFFGRVSFTGTLTVSGPFNNVSARLTGTLLQSAQGNELNYNATGLYQIDGDDWQGKYKGKLRVIANNEGQIVRKVQRRPLRVTRRKLYFDDGTIRLKRPIRATRRGTYKLTGRGMFRVKA